MTKNEFLLELKNKLTKLPEKELLERVNFYSEMIDDLVEDGATEEDAVLKVGNANDIAKQILTDYLEENSSLLDKINLVKKGKLTPWQITLLVVGSPIWISIIVSIFAVIISLFASVWAGIISLWAVGVSLAVSSLVGVIACVIYLVSSNVPLGIVLLACGIICAGLSILFYYCNLILTKCTITVTKKLIKWLKKAFAKREVA